MGNTKSSGQTAVTSTRRQPRLELPDDASPSSRHGSPRKGSRGLNSPRFVSNFKFNEKNERAILKMHLLGAAV